jgi:hypothetical protein
MKGKLTRVFALGFVLGISGALGACVTAPPPEQSIIDAVAAGSLAQPSSCEARGAMTVCVQTMRLNRQKDCSCANSRELTNGRFAPF